MRLLNLTTFIVLFVNLFVSFAFVPKIPINTALALDSALPLFATPDSTQTENTNISTEEISIEKENKIETSAPDREPESKEILRRQAFVEALLKTAKSLEGIRYKYAGKTPQTGFDCSGFVSYVFKQHGVNAPVSSRLYDKVGEPVALEDAQPGDVVCFTGTDPNMNRTGHVGIVVENLPGKPLKFVHASSGRAYSVTYSTIVPGKHYGKRFRGVRRISVPDTF